MGDGEKQQTSLTNAAALITGARTVQMAVVFVLSIPLSRLLTKPEYGVYLHATFLSSVLPLFVSAAAGKAVIFFLPRTGAPQKLLRSVAAVQLGVAFLIAGLFALVPESLAIFDPDDALLVEHHVIIGLVVGISFPYTAAEQVMLARGVRRGFALVLLCVATALLLGIGGALAFAPPGLELTWALRGLLGATSVQALAALWWMLAPAPKPTHGRPPTSMSEIMAFATPVVMATGISLLAARVDGFWIPGVFKSDAIKAEYFRGAMEPPVIGAIAFTLLSLIAPTLSRLHADEEVGKLLYLWRRTCRTVAILTVPIVGMVEAVASDLFLWVYPNYPQSIPVFRWYTALMLVRIFLPQVLMENTGAARPTVLVAFANLVLSVALVLVFSLAYGWAGAAPGVVLGTLIANWCVAGTLVKRHLRVGWNDIMDWSALVRLSAAAALSWGATHLVLTRATFDYWQRFPRIVTGCVVFTLAFAIAAPLCGAVTMDDVRAARKQVAERLAALKKRFGRA